MNKNFVYEKWNIATTNSTLADLMNGKWRALKIIDHQNKFQNAADPFYLNGCIYFEEFSYCDKGKIVQLNLKTNQRKIIFSPKYHVSFPTMHEDGFMVESISKKVLTVLDKNWNIVSTDTIASDSYLDPVIYTINDIKFLFSSKHGTQKHSVLNLFRMNDLGKWEKVVDEPICNSQFGGRMAGHILNDSNMGTIRFGQISKPNYGKAIAVFRINLIDKFSYSEELIGQINPPKGFDGIHTINVCEKGFVVDLRIDKKFSLLKIYQVFKKRLRNLKFTNLICKTKKN